MRGAILISGRGSNMTALLEAAKAPDYPVDFRLVISNVPDALGLATAGRFGVEAETIDHTGFDDRAAFESALNARLEAADIELVCLAGFMRILSADFVGRWPDRLVNIHPSLLPAYKGLHTHERALAAGETTHGCTVHLVRPAMDAGPILLQASVPVLADDTPDSLAARVLVREHEIYPQAVALLAGGGFEIDGDTVIRRSD